MLLRILTLSFLLLGCSKQNPSLSAGSGQDVETKLGAGEVTGLIGSYRSTSGRVAFYADQTYEATTEHEINLRTGPADQPTHNFYVICNILEYGKFSLVQKNGYKHIYFEATSASSLGATYAHRGDSDFDNTEACDLYAKAKTSQIIKHQYEVIGTGAIAVKDAADLSFGFYDEQPARYSELVDRPYSVGTLYSVEGRSVDVTPFMGRFLTQAYVHNDPQIDEKWPSHDVAFDPSSGRLTLTDNLCAFALDYKAAIVIKDGDLALLPVGTITRRTLENDASRFFAHAQSSALQNCVTERADTGDESIIGRGISVAVSHWMTIDFKLGTIEVHKVLPEALAIEGEATLAK